MANTLYQSTIGKKVIVASTGLVLFAFVVGHMLGNLQIFAGPAKINEYAALLKKEAALLWAVRIVLLVSVVLHAVTTVQLTIQNRKSRPVSYKKQEPIQSTLASRTMIWGGVFLICYIIFHLLHFTTGSAHPNFSPTDVYSNMVIGFSNRIVSAVYILGMIALGLHLYHGIFSVFQTLGLNHPAYDHWKRRLAIGFALVVSLGYISIPVAVLAGIVR